MLNYQVGYVRLYSKPKSAIKPTIFRNKYTPKKGALSMVKKYISCVAKITLP